MRLANALALGKPRCRRHWCPRSFVAEHVAQECADVPLLRRRRGVWRCLLEGMGNGIADVWARHEMMNFADHLRSELAHHLNAPVRIYKFELFMDIPSSSALCGIYCYPEGNRHAMEQLGHVFYSLILRVAEVSENGSRIARLRLFVQNKTHRHPEVFPYE